MSMWTQFVALCYGQLSGAQSLREIEGALLSHKARLYHLHAKSIKRSTLADANASRPSAVFAALFAGLMEQAHRGLRRALEETTYLTDSTSLRLSTLSAQWARFSAKLCGAKAHFVLDADAGVPVYMAVTQAKVNDITAAKAMPIEAGATYVFDLGYYDYGIHGALPHGVLLDPELNRSSPAAASCQRRRGAFNTSPAHPFKYKLNRQARP